MIRRPIDWRGVSDDLCLLIVAALLVAFAWVVVVFLFAAEVAK